MFGVIRGFFFFVGGSMVEKKRRESCDYSLK